MKKYQLVEKPTNGKPKNPTRVGALRNRLYFRKDDEKCYQLEAHVDYMVEEGLAEIDIWLAEMVPNSPYFFCKDLEEIGEKSEGGCGKHCDGYKPRNGKSGICENYGYTYEQTDRCFTLKLQSETSPKT